MNRPLQFRLVWLLSPLISVFSCCSARACHFCLFFLQPSSKGNSPLTHGSRPRERKKESWVTRWWLGNKPSPQACPRASLSHTHFTSRPIAGVLTELWSQIIYEWLLLSYTDGQHMLRQRACTCFSITLLSSEDRSVWNWLCREISICF